MQHFNVQIVCKFFFRIATDNVLIMSNFSPTSWLCFQNTSIHPSVCQLQNALRQKPRSFPFCPREEEEEETQVQPKFLFTWQYPPPLLDTFFLYISDLLQDHTPCTKTKLDIKFMADDCLSVYFFFFSSQIFKAID